MSVKGFKVGTEASEQYDYNFLDNKPDLSVYATKTEVAAVDDQALAAYPTDTETGAIASFPDGADGIPMKSILCTVNPLQDLHGYDAPWPAGGGKNKLKQPASGTTSANVTFTVNADGTITANGTSNGNADLYFVGASSTYEDAVIPSGAYILTCEGVADNAASRLFVVENGGNVIAAVSPTNPTQSVTLDSTKTYRIFLRIQNGGSVSNAVFKPMIRLSSIADDTFAPYSNICPISGFTGLTVTRTGKNLANFIDGKAIATDGTIIDYASRCATVDPIKIDPTKSYTVSSSVGNFIYAVWNGATLVRRIAGVPGGSTGSVLDTSGGTDLYVCCYSDVTVTVAESKPMVEIGSSASAYAPYTGNTIPISWQSSAGTVYGGTLDVVSGLLTVTMASIASYSGESITEPWISSMDACSPGGTPTTGAQVVYTLATPVIYQLTPTEVDSLRGDNVLWHDANGNTTTNYRADVTLYITKKIAEATA